MAAKFAPGLREHLAANGASQVHLILRVQGDPAQCRAQIEQAGFHVRRAFRLVPGFAVTGPASAALALADASWLTQVEPDRPIHTMK
jgi:hypothetical protein